MRLWPIWVGAVLNRGCLTAQARHGHLDQGRGRCTYGSREPLGKSESTLQCAAHYIAVRDPCYKPSRHQEWIK